MQLVSSATSSSAPSVPETLTCDVYLRLTRYDLGISVVGYIGKTTASSSADGGSGHLSGDVTAAMYIWSLVDH